jgi:ribonucleotide reductase beta subunit family protein with ferritin-like domain
MEKFKWMEKCLIENVEKQMTHLETVDAAELGEVIDMIKDLEQAMYYCSVVKAMEGKSDSSYSYATKSSTHDAREGWSHKKRKEYLESKEMHHDKAV